MSNSEKDKLEQELKILESKIFSARLDCEFYENKKISLVADCKIEE